MDRKAVILSFDLIDEYYNMVQIKADGTGESKSEIVSKLAKDGALLIIVENQYYENKDAFGRDICRLLKEYNIDVKIQYTKSTNYVRYEHVPTNDTSNIMYAKQKGPKSRIAVSLDPGFTRFVSWLTKRYDWTVPQTMATLIQYGLALKHCADREPDPEFPIEFIRKCKEIKNHFVIYRHDSDTIEVKKMTSNTQVDFKEILNNNESAAGLQGLQPMSKYTPSTSKDRKGVYS